MDYKLSLPTEKIKISVIVPIYNSDIYIYKNITSILNQTLKDIELILIEDCSTDSSFDIIKKLSNTDNRIKLITNYTHQGAGLSRNKGIKLSRGEYLSFLDSDDLFQTNYLEEMYDYAKSKDADIVFSKFNIIDENDHIISTNNGFWGVDCKNDINYVSYNGEVNIFSITTPAPWNKLYRRNFVLDNNLFFQDTRIANDLSFFKKSFFLAKSIYSIDISLVNYRKKWNGNTHTTRYLYSNDVFRANTDVKHFLLSKNATNIYIENFYISALSNFYSELKRFPKKNYLLKLIFIKKIIRFIPIHYYFLIIKKILTKRRSKNYFKKY